MRKNQSRHRHAKTPTFVQRMSRAFGRWRWRFLVIEAVLSITLLAAWFIGSYVPALTLGPLLIAVVVVESFAGGPSAQSGVGTERASEARH
jgi:hypothetical protein